MRGGRQVDPVDAQRQRAARLRAPAAPRRRRRTASSAGSPSRRRSRAAASSASSWCRARPRSCAARITGEASSEPVATARRARRAHRQPRVLERRGARQADAGAGHHLEPRPAEFAMHHHRVAGHELVGQRGAGGQAVDAADASPSAADGLRRSAAHWSWPAGRWRGRWRSGATGCRCCRSTICRARETCRRPCPARPRSFVGDRRSGRKAEVRVRNTSTLMQPQASRSRSHQSART